MSESTPQNPATRDRILDVAEALFAEHGYAGTSVRDIAGRVGLTPASLYNHFSGKSDLYQAVLGRGVRPLLELMRESVERPPGPDSGDELIGRIMEHLASRPHIPRLIHHEVVAGGESMAEMAKQWVRPLVEMAIRAMEREGSTWTRDEYPYAIAAWVHLLFGHFAMAPLIREVLDIDPLSPQGVEQQTEFLRRLAQFMAGAGPASPQDPNPES